MRSYFHGCTGQYSSGHGFYGPHERYVSHRTATAEVPFEHPDGGLAPKLAAQTEGVAKLHHKGGWTALAFWDRSGDERGNSNSVFFFEGTWTYEQALELAHKYYPESFERFDFEIRPVTRMLTRDEAIRAVANDFEGNVPVKRIIDAYEKAIQSYVPAEAVEHA